MKRFRVRFICALAIVFLLGVQQPSEAGIPSTNNLVYEVFVRSFADGDNDPNKIGDLKGVISKLDYLNDGNPKTSDDLEIGILWLMPIFPTRSYHGYDVSDFRDINPDYGTLDDFKTLVKEAHKRGIRIVLDLPLNHTSSAHPWFKEALKDETSPFRSFYQIRPDASDVPGDWRRITSPSGVKLRYFALFDEGMPDLDYKNQAVWKEAMEIAKFWLDLGVDGFRLDAAKHMFGDRFTGLQEGEILKNNDFWLAFSQFTYKINADAILFGEVLGDREINVRHSWGLDGLISEAFMNELRNQVSKPGPGFLARHKNYLTDARDLNKRAFNPKLGFTDQPFQSFDYIASHDRNPRLASDLEVMRAQGMRASVDEAYRMALHTLMTVSTRPLLYQGDEVMQKGFKWNGNAPTNSNPGDGSGVFDETLREPFPWYKAGTGAGLTKWIKPRFSQPNDGASKEEQEKEGGMLHLTKGLSRLRSRHLPLANGDIGAILSDSHEWMVCEKFADKDRYLVLMNLTGTGKDYRFHNSWFPEYIGARLIFWSDGQQKVWRDRTDDSEAIGNSVFVPPSGLVVLRKQ
jgi:alpha-amylase